jgi:hypothetical protein
MTSGQDVSEYIDTLGLVKSLFSGFLQRSKNLFLLFLFNFRVKIIMTCTAGSLKRFQNSNRFGILIFRHKKKEETKMSWYSDTPEDQLSCLLAGLRANPVMPLNLSTDQS